MEMDFRLERRRYGLIDGTSLLDTLKDRNPANANQEKRTKVVFNKVTECYDGYVFHWYNLSATPSSPPTEAMAREHAKRGGVQETQGQWKKRFISENYESVKEFLSTIEGPFMSKQTEYKYRYRYGEARRKLPHLWQ